MVFRNMLGQWTFLDRTAEHSLMAAFQPETRPFIFRYRLRVYKLNEPIRPGID